MCDLVSWGRCDVVAGYVWISKLSPCCCGLGVGALLPQYSGRFRLLGQYCCSTALGSSCCGGTAAVQGGGGYCFGGCFCVPQCSDRYCHNYHDCTDSMGGVAGRAGNGYKPLVAVASWPVVCCVDGHIVARCMQGQLRPCILMHKAPKKIKPSTLSLPSHFGLHIWLFHTVAAVLVE